MSQTGFQIRDHQAPHFITFTVVEWIDVFTRPDYRYIVLDSIKYCQKSKGLIVYAWVIMSNHLHLIASANEDYNLSNIIRDLKKYTSISIIEAIQKNSRESRKNWMLNIFREKGKRNSRNTTYQFWRQDNHPIELDTNEIIEQKLEYLHYNPVEAEIVEAPEDYLFSSARDYSDIPGLLEIERID